MCSENQKLINKYTEYYDKLNEYIRVNFQPKENKCFEEYMEEYFHGNKEFFRACRNLRNVFTHAKLTMNIKVDEEFVQKFHKICEDIMEKTAGQLCRDKFFYFVTPNYELVDVCAYMNNNNYTNAPIFENNDLIGVFSIYSCFKILTYAKNANIPTSNLKVKDILAFCQLNQIDIEYPIVSKNEKLFNLKQQMFNNNPKRTEAFFVQENKRIIGIITRDDLLH